MTEKEEYIEKVIRNGLRYEADDTQALSDELGEAYTPDAEVKDRMYQNIQKEISSLENEFIHAEGEMASLSEEDREALRLGRKLMAKRSKTRRTRILRVGSGLAAAVAAICMVGVNTIGHSEKAARSATSTVGLREVVKMSSGDNVADVSGIKEKEAYEKIKKDLGIKVVRVLAGSENLKFDSMILDDKIQSAELIYKSDGEKKLEYVIGTAYLDFSLGIDVDEKVVDEYKVKNQRCVINVKAYQTPKTKTEKYSAEFEYKGIGYYMAGTMEKKEFDKILKKLYFP